MILFKQSKLLIINRFEKESNCREFFYRNYTKSNRWRKRIFSQPSQTDISNYLFFLLFFYLHCCWCCWRKKDSFSITTSFCTACSTDLLPVTRSCDADWWCLPSFCHYFFCWTLIFWHIRADRIPFTRHSCARYSWFLCNWIAYRTVQSN